MKSLSCVALLAVLLLAGMSRARAQNPAAETLQQTPLPQQTASPVGAVPQDEDLGVIGVVQQYPKPATVSFSSYQEAFYTTNVFYTDKYPRGSAAYLGNYDLSYVPYSTRDWTPRIRLEYNMVRYDRVAAGDFDNETAVISSNSIISQDRDWSAGGEVDLARFTAPHLNDSEFYREVVYDGYVSYNHRIFKDSPLLNGAPLYFGISYDLTYHQASPDIYDRLDNILLFSLTYSPVRHLTLSPFVRPASRNYFTNSASYGQSNRTDFNLSEGLQVTWTPIQYFSLSADVTNTNDFSDNAALGYAETSPGAGITLTYKF